MQQISRLFVFVFFLSFFSLFIFLYTYSITIPVQKPFVFHGFHIEVSWPQHSCYYTSFTLEHWGKYMDYTWTVNTHTHTHTPAPPWETGRWVCLLLDMGFMLPRLFLSSSLSLVASSLIPRRLRFTRLVGRLVGRSVGWLVGQLAGWSLKMDDGFPTYVA